MKHKLKIFLLFVLAVGVFPKLTVAASFESYNSSYKGYIDESEYSYTWIDGIGYSLTPGYPNASVCDARVQGDTLVVPETVVYNGKTYVVNGFITTNSNEEGSWFTFNPDRYKKIVLPDTITHIDLRAFKGSTTLKEINMPVKASSMDVLALLYPLPDLKVSTNSKMENFKIIGSGIYTKNGGTLRGFFKEQKKYVVAKGTKYLSHYLLSENKAVREVNLPKSLKGISDYAFAKAVNLKKINLNNVEVVKRNAFYGCKSLKQISFGKKAGIIGESAFQGCRNLFQVTINSKQAPKIKKNAFKNTKSGIRFYVKNEKAAAQLKKQLKNSGAKKAKVIIKK